MLCVACTAPAPIGVPSVFLLGFATGGLVASSVIGCGLCAQHYNEMIDMVRALKAAALASGPLPSEPPTEGRPN